MQSHKQQIELLNSLIREANEKLGKYQALMKPIIDTQLEIDQHQRFFTAAKSVEKENEEAVVLRKLEKQLSDLQTKAKDAEKMDAEIKQLFDKIEAIKTQLDGKADRSSPSFLQMRK